MLCSHIRMILLLVPITQLTGVFSAKDACDNKICNNEAKCELKNGGPSCECIGDTYYTGKFCMEQVNNCLPNPCQNGAPCTNALGQPICGPCVAGFGGHLCDVPKAGTFTKMYLHHNRYGYLAVDEHFLFTLENLGSASFLLEFHADKYAIAAFKTEPQNPIRWQKSSDLARVARENGLHHADRLPYQSGFYYITKGRFWIDGLQKLRLKVTDVDSPLTYVEKTFNMQIYKDAKCRPEIETVHGADPFKPLMLDVERYTIIQIVVHKRCWESSQMKFNWKVFNNDETVLLHSYGQTSKPRLKISPYPNWATHIGELMQSFLIRIDIKENFGKKATYISSRCYIFVSTKPVLAKIVGGLEREVSADDSIVLDGSPSRHFAVSPILKSELYYSWKCESTDDPDNKNCAKDMSKDKVLIISMRKLKQGMTYKFTLEVRSKLHIFSESSFATQTIKLVDTQPLFVDIECVRNCEAHKFAPNELLHLMALCRNCDYGTKLKYTWTINGNQVAEAKRLIVENANNEETLTAEVLITSKSRKGKATVQLKRNTPPTGGNCKVTPQSGEELKTEFLISCQNFEDEDQSISYEFTAATFVLDRTSDPSTKVRLPKGNTITVKICDSLRACVTKSVNVNVREIDTNSGLVAFLKNYESTYEKLFRNGNIEQAMLLALTATRLIVSEDDAKYLSSQLQHIRLQTLLDIEQFLQVISSILKKVTPLKSPGADVLYKMLEILASGFENVLGDGEVRELMLKAYVQAQSELSSFLEALTNPTEKIGVVQAFEPLQVHPYNRIDESYPVFDISDTEILPRLNIWAKFSSSLGRCIQLMGLMASYVHEPEEPNTITVKSELQFDSFSFEKRTSQTLMTPSEVAKISVDSSLVFGLQMLLRSSSVLFQIISTPKNPFWWFPEKDKINTGVVFFSGFSSKLNYKFMKGLRLGDRLLELTMKLNNIPNSKENKKEHMIGKLLFNEDINIFELPVTENSLLVIYFISTKIDLRIQLALGCKPTGYHTHKSNIFIKKTGENKPEFLLNKNKKKLNAYLSVVPAENVDAVGDGDATYTFVAELRQCLTWDFHLESPQWTSNSCWPKIEDSMAKGMHCYCQHMSVYAGKVMAIPAISLFEVGPLKKHLPINWVMLCLQMVLGIIFICWTFLAYALLHPNREQLVVAPKNRNSTFLTNIFVGEVFIRITTGGYRNASTTAGIIIVMSTTNGPLKFKIYQNPIIPHLKQHSTCTVNLPLNPEMLTRPVTLYLRHDGGGRYPTWYCRHLEVSFVGMENPIYFSVESWVDETGLQLSESSEPRIRKHEKWKQFIRNLEIICTNWFFYNPVIGSWKYGNRTFNRFERTLVWMLKYAITILIISVYFGWTTLSNYESERDTYQYIIIGPLTLTLLCLLSFFVGCVLQFGIEYWVFKSNKETYESAV